SDAFYRACNNSLFFGTLSLRHFSDSLGGVFANFASFLSKPQIQLEPEKSWNHAQEKNNSQGKLSPDFERGKSKHKDKVLPGEYGGRIKDVGLRLGETRSRLRDLADEIYLPISDTLTFLALKAVGAYEDGEFRLELK
ncbi:MAG: hypothetical protein NTW32_15330, partial [Chloroflexi bacterium]|nr:hypothetical protein [Chloroflexota bacterium]